MTVAFWVHGGRRQGVLQGLRPRGAPGPCREAQAFPLESAAGVPKQAQQTSGWAPVPGGHQGGDWEKG